MEGTNSKGGRVKRFLIRFAVVAFALEIMLSIILTLLGVSLADVQ